jgi:hypothetical protein
MVGAPDSGSVICRRQPDPRCLGVATRCGNLTGPCPGSAHRAAKFVAPHSGAQPGREILRGVLAQCETSPQGFRKGAALRRRVPQGLLHGAAVAEQGVAKLAAGRLAAAQAAYNVATRGCCAGPTCSKVCRRGIRLARSPGNLARRIGAPPKACAKFAPPCAAGASRVGHVCCTDLTRPIAQDKRCAEPPGTSNGDR